MYFQVNLERKTFFRSRSVWNPMQIQDPDPHYCKTNADPHHSTEEFAIMHFYPLRGKGTKTKNYVEQLCTSGLLLSCFIDYKYVATKYIFIPYELTHFVRGFICVVRFFYLNNLSVVGM